MNFLPGWGPFDDFEISKSNSYIFIGHIFVDYPYDLS